MKKTILGVLVVSLFLLIVVGCQSHSVEYTTDEGHVEMEGDGTEGTIVVETEDGTQTAEYKTGADSWCQEGAEWSSTGYDASTSMIVEGIVESGKYEGYCHVTYDVETADTSANIDYYFDEEGNGYQVMEIDGQTYESSWTG